MLSPVPCESLNTPVPLFSVWIRLRKTVCVHSPGLRKPTPLYALYYVEDPECTYMSLCIVRHTAVWQNEGP